MATVQSYRDLRIWQQGVELVEMIYKITREFPKYEQFGLASQMQRAAVSIPSNIAEGHARFHLKEYLQFLSVARSSLAELETQYEIAFRLGYTAKENYEKSVSSMTALGKQILALRNSLSK
jgi:four helix bundle protein